MRDKRLILSVFAILFSFLLINTTVLFADGTETLGPPSITIAQGTGIVAAGTGLIAQPGTIEIEVPDGATVEQVLLYWEGFMATDTEGDNTIVIEGSEVTGTLIGGPAFFFSSAFSSAYRADITGLDLVVPGSNTLLVGGLDFTSANNGAGILVIYDDGSDLTDIDIRDGLDLAFINFPEPRKSTIAQTFSFDSSTFDRQANLALFFSSVTGSASGSDPERPSSIDITVDGTTTTFSNQLNSNDGDEWDTVNVSVTIPAGASSLTVQAFSRDDNNTGNLPASFTWTAAGLSVPPAVPEIDIRKQVEGPDSRTFVSGSEVTFEIEVTNTGNVDLTDVEVTDIEAPSCDTIIGDLAAGAIFTYECTVSNVTSSFENVACVTGQANGVQVEDCDPSTVEIIDIDIRKQAEGPDSRTFPPGSDVVFEIVVTNTGDEDLENVMVTDVLVPECDRDIGDLAAGASVSYTCIAPNVTQGFVNEACVSGERNGVTVEDCDPSTVEIEGGGEGCTPGYWKQRQHFDSWTPPFTPDKLFSDVFEDAFPGKTLLDVLKQGGGGLKALGRHTVAALLNAASPGVSYDLTEGDIIEGFNDVFPGGDYEGLKDLFEGFNEQGCPLN